MLGSQVIGRYGGDEKFEWPRGTGKGQKLKKKKKRNSFIPLNSTVTPHNVDSAQIVLGPQ